MYWNHVIGIFWTKMKNHVVRNHVMGNHVMGNHVSRGTVLIDILLYKHLEWAQDPDAVS
jgi:hypothetical protein